VADLTAAPSAAETRKLAERIYTATADLRAALAQERVWVRRPKAVAEMHAEADADEVQP
jgi:hypothetical protein